MHLIGIFTLATTTWDYIKDRWSYINKTMQPCYAITSSHLGLRWGRKRLQVHSEPRMMRLPLATSARLYLWELYCGFVPSEEEVASFLKHIKTKRKRAVCSSLVIVASLSVPLAEWQLLLTSYPVHSPSPLRVPWPRSIQRGETGAVKTHTSPCSRGERSSSCCPHGARCTLLLISSISSLEGTGPKWM